MPGCILRVSGRTFDVDRFLANSTFTPSAIFHCGESRIARSTRTHDTSGFNLEITDGVVDVASQVAEVLAFIRENRPELLTLANREDVDVRCLDFGVNFASQDAARFIGFPIELIRECAALRIEIEVSIYGTADPEVDDEDSETAPST